MLVEPFVTIAAMDLGNGHCKRTYDGVIIYNDPSVSYTPNQFFNNTSHNLISYKGSDPKYIGMDAVRSGKNFKSALGRDDIERYESEEYKELMFGFLAKDLQEHKNIYIPILVLGLPNGHYAKKRQTLIENATGKHQIKVGEDTITIVVEQVEVVPQPIGVFMHLDAQGKDLSGDTLIIDGGYDTLDVALLKNNPLSVVKHMDRKLGMKHAYSEILTHLSEEFGRSYNINEIPFILRDGLVWDGATVDIKKKDYTLKIMRKHYEFVRDQCIDEFGSFKPFNRVIWAGGMSLALKTYIETEGRNNFLVLPNAQEAIVQGFFEFGKGLM